MVVKSIKGSKSWKTFLFNIISVIIMLINKMPKANIFRVSRHNLKKSIISTMHAFAK
jgi:hypothetical protein